MSYVRINTGAKKLVFTTGTINLLLQISFKLEFSDHDFRFLRFIYFFCNFWNGKVSMPVRCFMVRHNDFFHSTFFSLFVFGIAVNETGKSSFPAGILSLRLMLSSQQGCCKGTLLWELFTVKRQTSMTKCTCSSGSVNWFSLKYLSMGYIYYILYIM